MNPTWRLLGVFNLTHSVPLSADVLGGEGGVRVDSRELDAVGLSDLQDLVVDAHGGHALFVGFGQSGLELVVSGDQTLKEQGGDPEQSNVEDVALLLLRTVRFKLKCFLLLRTHYQFISSIRDVTWISSMLWTMNMSCRSSMAPSIQLLKGAALLANSKYSWSMVSHSFSTRYKKHNPLD